ncbi:gas vesicle protein K [Actinoallomurus rhizosphaericola]|uniref:gas vesicle protein K n=1 Tax=Actinoallomurus rhizosphaericola TaxID=2952536 RepID=UPI00209338C1|nr:gas vesicle protein K [Actinoallomurus rhizosphaericola]MCO5998032.1 gas vesicle protein K [Actinoallomurus rhizosphaericola]
MNEPFPSWSQDPNAADRTGAAHLPGGAHPEGTAHPEGAAYSAGADHPAGAPVRRGGRRIEADSETVQRDLAQLVLTVVELVRQLVERQCIRRVDQGDLSDEQVEKIGVTLMRLEEAMEELCERFGLSMADLNLDLGPLGTLLPTDRD